MKLERPVCSVEMEHSLLSHELGGSSLLLFCGLEELCPLVLGVEALHSSSEKVKTCQEVKEVSFRKIFSSQE